MISAAQINHIASQHHEVLSQLHQLGEELDNDFHGMRHRPNGAKNGERSLHLPSSPITALQLAVASGEPLLFLGPPGTAKSALIRRLCFHLGMPGVESWENRGQKDGESEASYLEKRPYFEYLLTAFTEPGELFGFLEMKDAQITRNRKNMILDAKVVYLDEVFNASSAILNSLLSFLNEKRFHDRGRIHPVADGQLLFAASNHTPRTDELKAIYDRFFIRCAVRNLSLSDNKHAFDELAALVWKGFGADRQRPRLDLESLLPGLPHLRGQLKETLAANTADAAAKEHWAKFLKALTILIAMARSRGLGAFSNRRIVKMLQIMVMHRILRVADGEPGELGVEELELLPQFFVDRFDNESELHQLREAARREWSAR